jgi:transcriptional regulator with XRE-family HTH domain
MHNWLTRGIGSLIRRKRIACGLSLRALAQRTSASSREIARIERGNVDVDVLGLDSICAALGVEVVDLLTEAMAADDERILTVRLTPELTASLQCKHRDIIEAASVAEAISLLDLWRVDCIVINRPSDLQLRDLMNKVTGKPRLKRVIVCQLARVLDHTPEPTLPDQPALKIVHRASIRADVDALLLTTYKGRISNLRRVRDQCTEQRARLEIKGAHLAQQHQKILAQVQRLKKAYGGLLQFSPNDKASARWDLLIAELNAKSDRIGKNKSILKVEMKAVDEHTKFIDRNVAWLEDQAVKHDLV